MLRRFSLCVTNLRLRQAAEIRLIPNYRLYALLARLSLAARSWRCSRIERMRFQVWELE